MPKVIATHAVGNMETWLAGGDARTEIFKQFCSAYRIYRSQTENRVAILWENTDLEKMESALKRLESESAKARHTVIEPIDIYIEVEGGR